jgi:hypothetical protein
MYFRGATLQLYLYQFSRVQAGPGKGGYTHPKFSKQNKNLCREMTPKKAKPVSGGLHESRPVPSKAAPNTAKPSSASLLSLPVVASLPFDLSTGEQQSYHRQRRSCPFPKNGITTIEQPFFSQRGQGKYIIDNASRLFPQLDPHQEQHQPSRFSYPLGFDLEPTPIREPPMPQTLLALFSCSPPLQNASPSIQEPGPLLGWGRSEERPRIFLDQLLSHGHQVGGLLTGGGGGTSNDSSMAFSSPIVVPGGSIHFAAFQQLRAEGMLQQRQFYEQFQEEERRNIRTSTSSSRHPHPIAHRSSTSGGSSSLFDGSFKDFSRAFNSSASFLPIAITPGQITTNGSETPTSTQYHTTP